MREQDALDWLVNEVRMIDHDCRTPSGDGCKGCADIETARETLQAAIDRQADYGTIKEVLLEFTDPRPKFDGMTAHEVATIMLSRLRERNKRVNEMARRLKENPITKVSDLPY